MTDPTRDDHATHYGHLNSPPSSDYVVEREVREAKQRAREQREAEAARAACDKTIPYERRERTWSALCGRPAGHDGDCWPVPLDGDRTEGEDA